MSRKYDKRTNMFDQEGKISQINYAVDAINNAGTAIGMLFDGGIALVCEKDTNETLLEVSRSSEKIFALDSHLFCIMSGMEADANYLIDKIRELCQWHRYNYRAAMPIDNVVQTVCGWKQNNTLRGGRRPFGIGFTYAGWDEINGHQIWHSDPAGVFGGWKAHAQGRNSMLVNNYLKQEYKEEMSEKDCLDLAVKCMCKALDATEPDANKLNIMIVKRNGEGSTVSSRRITVDEVKELIKEKVAKEESEKKK